MRRWAAETSMVKDLKDELRIMNLPKCVWVLELHLNSLYANHCNGVVNSLVGFVLIVYQNKNYPLYLPNGTMVLFDNRTGLPLEGTKADDPEPLIHIRN